MDRLDPLLARTLARRRLLGAGALGLAAAPALAKELVDLDLPGGNGRRPLTDAFPGKRGMILQRARPPLLETPLTVFDSHIFTPNDRFFVRWHWSDIPTAVDVNSFRLKVTGHVVRPYAITLADIVTLPRVELAAINQCSGNSRGYFQQRVPGAQWGHGAMGNARWLGVRLKDLLDLAKVRAGAVAVRFGGLDNAAMPGAPDFVKSLALDHARDGEVIVAFAMNGEQLPLLNGFPLRLVVPGWFSTYWIKALDTIEVLARPDDGYWMAKAYRVPTAPDGNVAPGSKDFPTEPINRMIPRSWITNLAEGARVPFAPTLSLRGIAMGGDQGVAAVQVSADRGRTWRPAALGADQGRYGFRRWTADVPVAQRGALTLLVRARNTAGVVQTMTPVWNPGGYLRGNAEAVTVTVA